MGKYEGFRRVHKIAKKTVIFVMSVCLSVRPTVPPSAWNNSATTGRIFTKFDI